MKPFINKYSSFSVNKEEKKCNLWPSDIFYFIINII